MVYHGYIYRYIEFYIYGDCCECKQTNITEKRSHLTLYELVSEVMVAPQSGIGIAKLVNK